jgi:hypothetical protein
LTNSCVCIVHIRLRLLKVVKHWDLRSSSYGFIGGFQFFRCFCGKHNFFELPKFLWNAIIFLIYVHLPMKGESFYNPLSKKLLLPIEKKCRWLSINFVLSWTKLYDTFFSYQKVSHDIIGWFSYFNTCSHLIFKCNLPIRIWWTWL